MHQAPLEALTLRMQSYPSRIVCLSADSADILFELGVADRIVGVTAFAAQKPDGIPCISGFSTVHLDKVDALKPDLVIAFSDVQANAARELICRGRNVLTTNQRSLTDIFHAILLLGRIVGKAHEAEILVQRMRVQILGVPCSTPMRPKVYFEEWDEPFISGIQWVSELIEAAGGCDIFQSLRNRPRAMDRQVTSAQVIACSPDVIIASWCGKKADIAAIARRPGWDAIPAVKLGRIYEINSDDLLQPGPRILKGFERLREIIQDTRLS